MRFHAGDRVRVKSFEEISSTLDHVGYTDDIYFNPQMKEYCGQTFVVSNYSWSGHIQLQGVLRSDGRNGWRWHESWLEPARQTFSDLILGEDKYEF